MSTQSKYATYPSLKDKVVVISGGATGIGAAMVEAFVLQGSQVVFLDIQPEAASELINRLGNLQISHSPIYHQCDVTDIEGALKPLAANILAQFPKIHGLINNVANDVRHSTLSVTSEQWDKSIAVNFRHQFFLTQSLLPGLIAAESSSVINMGSCAWVDPVEDLIIYNSCKSGIVGLTRTLAVEFGRQGVRVNSIMPGAIATERQKLEILNPEVEAKMLSRQALKRLLDPSEIARLALWLISDDSSAITKQSIIADAGYS